MRGIRFKPIAGALLSAVSSIAWAQKDEVRLGGVVEVGYAAEWASHKERTHFNQGPRSGLALFRLTGAHHLGNDWSARFHLETGFDILSGRIAPHRIFNRASTIGVAHPAYGSLEFGRWYNLAALYVGAIDPFGTSYGGSGADSVVQNGIRQDNLVLYRTPTINGWDGGIGYSFNVDSVTHASENERHIKALSPSATRPTFYSPHAKTRMLNWGLRYNQAPWHIVATQDTVFRRSDIGSSQNNQRIYSYMVGASYQANPIGYYAIFGQAYGGWISAKNMPLNPLGPDRSFASYRFADGFRATYGMVGISLDQGPHRYMASWQQAWPSGTQLTGDNAIYNVFALGYRYTMSKRSELRAYGVYNHNFAFTTGAKGATLALFFRHYF